MLFHIKGFKRHFAALQIRKFVVSFFHVTNRCSIFKMWIYLSSFADFTPRHCRETQISGQYQLCRLTLQHCGIKTYPWFLKISYQLCIKPKIQSINIYNNLIFLFLFFKFVICLLLIRNRNVLHSNNATFAYTSC